MEYLLILMVLTCVSIFLKLKYKIKLYPTWQKRFLVPLMLLAIGMAWDTWAVFRETWTFGGKGLVGCWVGLLPFEEYVFMIVFPILVIIIYKISVR